MMEEIKITLIFKKEDGIIIDNVEKYVKDWAQENPYGNIIIGCDSQIHGRKIKYSVVICMHYKDAAGQGHGAHVISCNIWEKRLKMSKKEEMPYKLWKEAEYVLQVAQMIDNDDEVFKKRISVHLDFNSNETAGSNIVYHSGLGLIRGMGYAAIGKPNAPIASHTADHYCR